MGSSVNNKTLEKSLNGVGEPKLWKVCQPHEFWTKTYGGKVLMPGSNLN